MEGPSRREFAAVAAAAAELVDDVLSPVDLLAASGAVLADMG